MATVTRRFEVRVSGHVNVKDADGVIASLERGFGEALKRCKGGDWSTYDDVDDEGRPRVEFEGQLYVDAVHADQAADIVFGLLDGPISAAIASGAGGDWEIARIIDPSPDPRDLQYQR